MQSMVRSTAAVGRPAGVLVPHVKPTCTIGRGVRVDAFSFPGFFDVFNPNRLGSLPQRATVQKKRDALLNLLVPRDGGEGTIDSDKANALIDELVELQPPFKLQDLSGGPGVVVYTRGPAQLWDSFQRLFVGSSSRRRNRASQDLDAGDMSLVNAAELWGQALYITAAGTFQPLVEEAGTGKLVSTPLTVVAFVNSGTLHLGENTALPLPIRGRGEFQILYCDRVLRVFRSKSSYSVQVKASYLDSVEN